ncbi:MAG TPA: hypothetical protein VGL56_20335 [Fimbriimonadaceae bacterium]|jgi:hypothetical protein
MLSFLPALILLMFGGHSVLEQAQLNKGITPGDALYQRVVLRRGSLFGLVAQQTISNAVAEILHLAPVECASAQIQPDPRSLEPQKRISSDSEVLPSEAFAECERSRDGPVGL